MLPKKTDIVILADSWEGSLMAYQLRQLGHNPVVLSVGGKKTTLPIHIGNGEWYESVFRTFGKQLASDIWAISQRNYNKVKRLFRRLKVNYNEGGLLSFANDDREAELLGLSAAKLPDRELLMGDPLLSQGNKKFTAVIKEPAIYFDPRDLSLGEVTPVDNVHTIRKLKFSSYELSFENTGQKQTIQSSIVVVFSDRFASKWLKGISDKLIPVTYSTFSFPKGRPCPDFTIATFNGAADFAIASGDLLRLGSFRGLYEHRAVGVRSELNERTQQGVSEFFGQMKWIGHGDGEGQVDVTTLSCDGLPVVGALPDLPGVFVVGGFAARSANYIFDVTEELAKGILTGGNFAHLQPFSLKRFV